MNVCTKIRQSKLWKTRLSTSWNLNLSLHASAVLRSMVTDKQTDSITIPQASLRMRAPRLNIIHQCFETDKTIVKKVPDYI